MAMIANAFISLFVENLVELAKEEVTILLGVRKDLKSIEKKLHKMKTVIEEAEKRSLEEDPIINNWLKDLKEVMYDADDIIDECRIEGEMQRSSSAQLQQFATTSRPLIHSTTSSLFCCFGKVTSRHDIGRRIMEINTKLDEIYKESSGFYIPEGNVRGRNTWRENKMLLKTSPIVVDSEVVGLEKDVNDLVKKLIEGNKKRICVFAIWGMGGIGKTTLAQQIYNNEHIQAHFDIKMWVCVSQNFTEIDLLKEIIRQGKGSYGESQTRAELDPILKDLVGGKKFLLVLDDVWDEKVWENLLRRVLFGGHTDSRVLVTSRKKEVGLAMGAHLHEVELLSMQDGWSVLKNKLLHGSPIEEIEELRCVGVEIVKKCKNLPLAIQTIGGVLIKKERKREAWERVLASPAWSFTTLPEEILPALYLSYEDLPSQHKQCFLYCSLFPEDYQFEQPYLVTLWIAEGFVNAQEGLAAEDVAREVYKDLISRSLLQVDPSYANIYACKVHDLLRLLTLFVAKRDNQSENLQSSSVTFTTIRRLSIINQGISQISEEITNQKCLRTLILRNNSMIVNIPKDVFEKLQRLRVLDVTGTQIEKLPKSVKNLLHLRYLDVSFTRLSELPESIKCLKNLLTLNVSGCKNLHKLPSAIVHLPNLRHLLMNGIQVDYLPIGIGNLKHLQELTGYVVAEERGNEGYQGANLKELKSLSSLRRLYIAKLERVGNKTEAQDASLSRKSKLEALSLSCSRGLHFEEGEIHTIKECFEALTPPPCLEMLKIESFFGRDFPSWISGSSLPNLTSISLKDCMLYTKVPPLGQLRKLRNLEIIDALSVKSIGAEFLGGTGAFPQLEKLIIKDMCNWEEWVGLENGDLPRLKEMTLADCPKLKSLPYGLRHATSFTKLWIWNNPMLECVSNPPTLEIIEIHDCPALKEMENLDALRSLRLDDGNMDVLPEWLGSITTLQQLTIFGNTNLLNRCAVGGDDWDKIRHIPQLVSFRKESNPSYDERVPHAAIVWAENENR